MEGKKSIIKSWQPFKSLCIEYTKTWEATDRSLFFALYEKWILSLSSCLEGSKAGW